jgi:hypothetical protein
MRQPPRPHPRGSRQTGRSPPSHSAVRPSPLARFSDQAQRALWGSALTFTLAHGAPALAGASAVLTPLAEPAGMALLSGSQQRADYGTLAETFLTQANLAYCGVASSVMALNSLAVPAPPASGYGRYRFWTQDNLFAAEASRAVLAPEQVARRGMTLQQLRALLASTGVQATAIHGDALDMAAFRRLVAANLANPRDRLLVNYLRSSLGQQGGGHISPLAAYHAPSDRVLLLDVARYRYPSVWVPLQSLWKAMRTTDPDSRLSRGLVIVSRPSSP